MPTEEQPEPNLYVLEGEGGGPQVTYSLSSIKGEPEFSYQGFHGENVFSGDAIAVSETELGREVTVTLVAVADGDTITFTVLIPPIRMEGNDPVPLETLAIETTKKSGFAGPPPGSEYSYEAIPLSGDARSVKF
jgi:hypothetical protein